MKKIFFIVLLLAAAQASASYKNDTIRVAVEKGAQYLNVAGSNLVISIAGPNKGQPTFSLSKANIATSGNAISVNDKILQTNHLLIKSGNQTFYLNDKKFLGQLDVYVTNGRILAVNTLPVEEYLVGVLNSEMPTSWPIEAKKAQLVAARTYSLYQMKNKQADNKFYDVEATTSDQVFNGFNNTKDRDFLIAKATQGEALFQRGKLIKAFFHSCSGGQTTTSQQVWDESLDSGGVSDPYSESCPDKEWSFSIRPSKLAAILNKNGYNVGKIDKIQLYNNEKYNRIDTIKVYSRSKVIDIPSNKFRLAVSPTKIKSTNFIIETIGENLVFKGSGFGHGVGLSQWGAKKMAEKGFNYKEILEFYYPNTELGRAY